MIFRTKLYRADALPPGTSTGAVPTSGLSRSAQCKAGCSERKHDQVVSPNKVVADEHSNALGRVAAQVDDFTL